MRPFRPLPLVLVFGYVSITALAETSVPFPSLPSSLHKRGLWDLAKAGRPETARHPRKVSDRIQSFISEGERGAIEPAVTVGRKVGEKTHICTHTHTPNLCGDWMSKPTSRARCDGLSWFTTSAPWEVERRLVLSCPTSHFFFYISGVSRVMVERMIYIQHPAWGRRSSLQVLIHEATTYRGIPAQVIQKRCLWWKVNSSFEVIKLLSAPKCVCFLFLHLDVWASWCRMTSVCRAVRCLQGESLSVRTVNLYGVQDRGSVTSQLTTPGLIYAASTYQTLQQSRRHLVSSSSNFWNENFAHS